MFSRFHSWRTTSGESTMSLIPRTMRGGFSNCRNICKVGRSSDQTPVGTWSTRNRSGLKISAAFCIIEARSIFIRSTLMLRLRGQYISAATLTIDGILIRSIPSRDAKNAPGGHPTSNSTFDPGVLLTKRDAIFVFLRRCPNPKPSCEYAMMQAGSREGFERLIVVRSTLNLAVLAAVSGSASAQIHGLLAGSASSLTSVRLRGFWEKETRALETLSTIPGLGRGKARW